MNDELDELLGIDNDDPLQRLAAALVDADDRLLRDLVARRGELGLTQAQVGERMGVSQPAVARFERADADPRLSALRRYALAVHALVTHAVGDGMPARALATGPRRVLARRRIGTAAPSPLAGTDIFVQAPRTVAAR